MKKLVFATAAVTLASAFALGGCNRGSEDVVNNVELNQPSADVLNDEANQAALDAANAEANMTAPPPVVEDQNAAANVDNPSDDEEQNVSGM